MDDDLLGGPPAGSKPPVNLDDDLLGGPAAPPANAMALDDDLLFGSGPAAPAPAQAAQQQSAPQDGDLAEGFTQLGPKVPLKIPPVKEAAQALVHLVDANTFYLRPLILIADDGARSKCVTRITTNTIQILNENGADKLHEVMVEHVIGVITQGVIVSRMLSKDHEMQAIVQVSDGKDIHIGFPKEAGGDAVTSFSNVLTAVCASVGLMLPVCTLNSGEVLTDHIQRIWVDPRLRRQLCESLAYRTELANELNALQREDNKLELSIASIKGSNEGHQVIDIVAEVQQLDMLISSYTHKTAEAESMIQNARGQLEEVRQQLRRELQRREEAVSNAVEDKQKERLQKQVADYEVAKAAHKREMERLAAVTGVYERRSKDRTKDAYTINDLPLRLDDLEEQLEEITSRLTARGDAHSKRVKALAENKKRMAQAEDVLTQLKDDIKAIEAAPDDADLPERLVSLEVPDLSPQIPTGTVEGKPPAASPAPAAAAAPAAAPAAKPAAKTPISLSDDDI
eukprot:CAMPEP_0174844166 /NCGR_PEP_ID=MMETSP1114-20130205/10938_1 /TAXON_ID=312471 /ORGANISM="Neobodo designis, Strain CCAP 1951/1" /LENGTH=511 /DNA_ID=CAMNT_0016078399 /DNA_START=29 /DNA_END=1564 /DNA_ORIENTATION=-